MYIHGYRVSDGYMGRVRGHWMKFKSEDDFRISYAHRRGMSGFGYFKTVANPTVNKEDKTDDTDGK